MYYDDDDDDDNDDDDDDDNTFLHYLYKHLTFISSKNIWRSVTYY